MQNVQRSHPKPRRVVESLKPYSPPLEGRRTKTRLDFNENTVGFPHIIPAGYDVNIYTAYPEYQALIDALAVHLDVPTACIMLTNGSDEALDVIPRTFIEPGKDKALTTRPGFHMIQHNLRLTEADLTLLSLTPELGYPLNEIEAELTSHTYKLAIFATPDNPTGAIIPKEAALQWSARFPETLFVMDEAYAAYRPKEASCLKEACTASNLLVTQTFSKAYGLAGLRLGYVVGHPTLLAYMKRVRSPYSVNAQAVQMALHLLERPTEIQAQVDNTLFRREALMQQLRERGYTLHAGPTNYFLIKLGLQASIFARYAADMGILVRDQSHQHLLNGWVRISVGSEGENLQLLDVLEAFNRKTALVFDFDDTLVDTSQSFDKVVAYMVNKHSEVPLGTKELNLLRAEGGYNDDWDAILELLRRRNVTLPREQIQAEGTVIYHNLAKQSEKWMLPVEDLAALKKRYALYVFTGRERNEYAGVWDEEADPYFKHVYCSDDLSGKARKPAPDYLQHIQQTHQLSHMWYIGNSVDDMRCAKVAGYHALGVATTFTAEQLIEAGADAVILDPTELKEAFAC
jgi:histidinol-phosphate aminotransferase